MEHDPNPPSGPGTASGDAALAAAVARLRRSVAAGGAVDLATLRALAQAAAAAPHRGREPAGTDMARLNLLDEVDLLVGELGREHAALLEQLRAMTRHRRAGGAYGGRNDRP